MDVAPLLLLLGLLAGCTQADTSYNATDYRVRGHMTFKGILGAAGCADSFIYACGQMGAFTLRASPADLKVLPPVVPVAVFHGALISCPEGAATVQFDSNGKNGLASGSFYSDPGNEALVPATPFTMYAGGGDHGLQLRVPATQCTYTFELTDATNYILDTAPVQWTSILSGARRSSALPAALALAAAAAAALVLLG